MSVDKPTSGDSDGYVVVARRYRPRGFDELVGQDHVGRALRNAIETSRVGHAYLFTGARGVGKTSTARIFAKALNDPGGPTAAPDAASDVAQAIDAGEDVDVIEIDGASNRGIDEIRSLRANVGVRPSRSRYKIYIIDEVHMLTPPAFNALLKTLEEPPEHVKFIFCTTDPEKIPITVLSRCQRFDFAPVEVSKIVTRLGEIIAGEGAQADEDALELIARRAAGSMRDSQSLLEQVLSFSDGRLTAQAVHAMLGTADDARLHELAGAMADRDSARAMQLIDGAIESGVDAGRLAEQLLGYFRDLMTVTVGCEPGLLRHTSVGLLDELKTLGDRWGLQTVLAVVGLIDETLVRIRHSVYSRVLLEATLIQICNLPDLQRIADLASAAKQAGAAAVSSKPAAEKKKQPLKTASSNDSTADHSQAPSRVAASADKQAEVQRKDQTQAPAYRDGTAPHVAEHLDSPNGLKAAAGSNGASSVAESVPPADKSVEAKLEQVVQASNSGRLLQSQSDADAIWQAAFPNFEDMTTTLVRSISHIQYETNGKIRLVFPGEFSLAMRRCETSEHVTCIERELSRVAGKSVKVDFQLLPAKRKVPIAETSSKGPSRAKRMKEIETSPLIQSCVSVLGAEIVRIDRPK